MGDREKIIVHKESWIPRPTTFKPLSTPTLDNDATVSNLIHRDNRWNAELVKQHFMEEGTDLILNIPLPKTPHKDSILWHFDKKGAYSVKSGYQLAMKIKYPDTPGCSKDNPCYWNIL